MSKKKSAPFYVGQQVVSISNFKEVRKYWGFNYPKKGEIVKVLTINKHWKYNFWLITIANCEVELYHKNFAPLHTVFKPIKLKKVIKKETKFINAN